MSFCGKGWLKWKPSIMHWNLFSYCRIWGYLAIKLQNFFSIISVTGRETCYQSVPTNCIQIFGGHTPEMKFKYLDMGTSFVNRHFDDLEMCFSLSTILASFPGTGFNFSWLFDKLSGQTYNVDTQTLNAHKFETKLHLDYLVPNVSQQAYTIHTHACSFQWFVKWWS